MLLPTDAPAQPPVWATQKDAALVLEGFHEALNACNADKATILEIFGLNK